MPTVEHKTIEEMTRGELSVAVLQGRQTNHETVTQMDELKTRVSELEARMDSIIALAATGVAETLPTILELAADGMIGRTKAEVTESP